MQKISIQFLDADEIENVTLLELDVYDNALVPDENDYIKLDLPQGDIISGKAISVVRIYCLWGVKVQVSFMRID